MIEIDYTRVSAKSRTLIDLIFTDIIDVVESGVKPYIISDHLPIYIIRKKPREIRMYERLIRRSYFRYSKERIAEMIPADKRWWDFWHLDLSVNDMWELMYNIFITQLNLLCPFKTVKVQTNKPTWISGDIKSRIAYKNDLYRKAKSSNKREEWKIFKIVKKEVSKELKRAKIDYMKGRLNE